MNKALLLSILIIGIVILGCTGGSTAKKCKASEDCESWRECNLTAGTCMLRKGYCDTDAMCGAGRVCNKLHRCESKGGFCNSTADCDMWQVCDEALGRCMTGIGFCADDNFCLNDWEACDISSHTCALAPGRCIDSFDCDTYQMCNDTMKRCTPLPGRCDTNATCERWQSCDVKTHSCTLKAGFCENDGNCKAAEYCDSGTLRCKVRKLGEDQKILKEIDNNGTTTYTLKKSATRSSSIDAGKVTGGVAEIPLSPGKTLIVFDVNATEGPVLPVFSGAFIFDLLPSSIMQGAPKGGDVSFDFSSLPQKREGGGMLRLDTEGNQLVLATANWYVQYSNWEPMSRMNLSSLGIKSGDRFRVTAEFDHASGGGVLTLYIQNQYGMKKRIASANYTTYINADGQESVAASIGGVWSVTGSSREGITLTVESITRINEANFSSYSPGGCIDDAQCNPWELCNPITHLCYLKLGWCLQDTDCPAGYNCKLDPRTVDRRICVPIACGSNFDCPGSTCDIEMHLCRPVPPYCGPDNYTCYEAPRKCIGANLCAPWEDCDGKTGACVTKIGMCGSDMDCPVGTLCELNPQKQEAHVCKPTVCNTDFDCLGTTCDTYRHQCRPTNP